MNLFIVFLVFVVFILSVNAYIERNVESFIETTEAPCSGVLHYSILDAAGTQIGDVETIDVGDEINIANNQQFNVVCFGSAKQIEIMNENGGLGGLSEGTTRIDLSNVLPGTGNILIAPPGTYIASHQVELNTAELFKLIVSEPSAASTTPSATASTTASPQRSIKLDFTINSNNNVDECMILRYFSTYVNGAVKELLLSKAPVETISPNDITIKSICGSLIAFVLFEDTVLQADINALYTKIDEVKDELKFNKVFINPQDNTRVNFVFDNPVVSQLTVSEQEQEAEQNSQDTVYDFNAGWEAAAAAAVTAPPTAAATAPPTAAATATTPSAKVSFAATTTTAPKAVTAVTALTASPVTAGPRAVATAAPATAAPTDGTPSMVSQLEMLFNNIYDNVFNYTVAPATVAPATVAPATVAPATVAPIKMVQSSPPVMMPRIYPMDTLPPTIMAPKNAPAVVAVPAAPATFAFASLNIVKPENIAPIKPIVFNNMFPSQHENRADPMMIEIENINKMMKETNEIAFQSCPSVDHSDGDYTSGMILKTYAPDVDPIYARNK
jgi:hypothetical protein